MDWLTTCRSQMSIRVDMQQSFGWRTFGWAEEGSGRHLPVPICISSGPARRQLVRLQARGSPTMMGQKCPASVWVSLPTKMRPAPISLSRDRRRPMLADWPRTSICNLIKWRAPLMFASRHSVSVNRKKTGTKLT